MNALSYQQACIDDIDELLPWLKSYYEYDHITFESEGLARGLRVLLSDRSQGGAWFISQQQERIGYFVLTFGFDLEFGGKQATLTEFYLREQSRGAGHGRATIEYIEALLASLGVGALELQAEKSNTRALAFYQRLGFTAHERIPFSKELSAKPPPKNPEISKGLMATNCGRTTLTLALSANTAELTVYSRWMGSPEWELTIECEHRTTGTLAGILRLKSARLKDGTPLSLPPSDGVILVEYLRVPAQPAPYAGNDNMEIVGCWTSPFTMLLWLHRDSHYDDGTQLSPEEYDPPVSSFELVVEALSWLESPWKLA